MKRAVGLIVIGFLLLLTIAYFRTLKLYKFYNYEIEEKTYSEGVVGARLIGRERYTNTVSIIGNPYELFLWISPKNNGETFVNSIKIITINSESVVFENKYEQRESLRPSEYGENVAYFEMKNINIDYEDYILMVEFTRIFNGQKRAESIELKMKRAYKEYRKNRILQRFMSA